MNLRLTFAAMLATLLASLALYPLLSGWRWFWMGAGGALLIAAIGAVTRIRVLSAAACFLATIAGGFLYLNAVYAGRWSWARVIPTRASVHHLESLVTQASNEMSRYAPPVPPAHGIMLMVTAGICLVAAITDLLAVRLRRPALAGLPLLVLFCVPLTTDAARPSWFGGTLVFCLGMGGYLGLLSADGRDRLRLWGRLVHRWQDDHEGRSPDTRPLSVAGRRVGSAAVVIAVCIPLLLPGLKQHRLFHGSGGPGGTGHSGRIPLPNPLDELQTQLHESHPQTVLTYRTSFSAPPYLQVYVLSQLGTDAWTMAPPADTAGLGKGILPPVPGLVDGTGGNVVHESIKLGARLTSAGAQLTYLPLPYAARWVRVSGSWRVDPATLTVLAPHASLGGLGYTVTTDDVNPSTQQLRAAGAPPATMDGYLLVPQAFSKLGKLARKITAGRTTAYGKALALQEWFTRPGNFTYSLHVPATRSADALAQFLTRSKRGYCQQFAFAMAVLARLLHIPSRVVVGYTQGTYVNGAWVVRTSDAHAWPELYFPGAGWLRFEPTPTGYVGHAGQATANAPAYTGPSGGGIGGPPVLPAARPASGALPSTSPGLTRPLSKLRSLGESGRAAASRPGNSPPVAPLVLGLLGLMVITPRTTRSVTRRWRWWKASDDRLRAHAAWRELLADLADHRIAWRPSESPRALARRLAQTLGLSGGERAALERIALAEERASYADSPADSSPLRGDVTVVRRALARRAGLPARMSAAVLPLSALAPARTGLQRALEVLGWIDVALARVRTRARVRSRAGRHQASPDRHPGSLTMSWRA